MLDNISNIYHVKMIGRSNIRALVIDMCAGQHERPIISASAIVSSKTHSENYWKTHHTCCIVAPCPFQMSHQTQGSTYSCTCRNRSYKLTDMSMTKHSNMSIVIKKLGKRIPVAISLQSLHTFDLFSTQPKYVFDYKELVRSYLAELFTKLFSHFGITFTRAIC